MLNSIGVETSQAESGQQALGMIVDRTPDIVLTDIRIPDMDGQQLMERLHQSYDSMKIVAVTASVFDRDRQTYLDAGFDDFLDKPVRTELLYACLARQLRVEYDLVEPGESDGDAWRTAPLTSELLSAFDEVLRQRVRPCCMLLSNRRPRSPPLWPITWSRCCDSTTWMGSGTPSRRSRKPEGLPGHQLHPRHQQDPVDHPVEPEVGEASVEQNAQTHADKGERRQHGHRRQIAQMIQIEPDIGR